MERQPDRQPMLVLMAGLPGSGKSTLARALGLRLGWPVLDKDLCKASFMDFRLNLAEVDVGHMAYDWLFIQARDFLVNQRLSIIFDTPALYPSIVDEILKIVHDTDILLKTILCSASASLRRERLTNRSPTHEFMRPMHTASITDDLAYFNHLPADKLVIKTHQNLDECLTMALEYLRAIDQVTSKRDMVP
jgi:predicted kinase